MLLKIFAFNMHLQTEQWATGVSALNSHELQIAKRASPFLNCSAEGEKAVPHDFKMSRMLIGIFYSVYITRNCVM